MIILNGCYLTHDREDKRVHTIHKAIYLKVNVMARVGFHYDVVVQNVIHDTTGHLLHTLFCSFSSTLATRQKLCFSSYLSEQNGNFNFWIFRGYNSPPIHFLLLFKNIKLHPKKEILLDLA